MARKPANEKLWAVITSMARAKFATYPSPGASAWVHKQYVQKGGQFVDTDLSDKKRKMLSRQFEAKKRKHLEMKKKAKHKRAEKHEKKDKD